MRFGGGDKTAAPIGDSTVLGRVVADLPAAWEVVVVGQPRPVPREVTWTREHPPGGGPLAGIAAGVAALDERVDVVAVLAGDQPFAGSTAPRLVAELGSRPDVDVAAARQADGRAQLLLAAYRAPALRAALTGDVHDRGVHRALSHLTTAAVDVADGSTLDVDTPADLQRARDALSRHEPPDARRPNRTALP